MSIWEGVDREDFESTTWELHKIAPSQKSFAVTSAKPSRHGEASNRGSQQYTLPIGVEKQVCDDIAFLAAWECSPECVTAASLQESANAGGITVNLAANEGISTHVMQTLDEIFRLLEACAQRVSRENSASQCLDKILELHRDRIRQRLGLTKISNQEQRARQDFVSVLDRLKMMVEDVPESGNRVVRASLLLEINILISAIDELENGNPNDLSYIKDVVEAASKTAKRNESFTKRLQRAGYGNYAQRKEIRQLKGLANYKHCCDYLCKSARLYRAMFTSVKLNTIPAYKVEMWPSRYKRKHFVHAEIQLLLYHGMSSESSTPRCIGVSKRACFLCYCFMRRYGTYITPETHGEVHPQWTIPDRDDYNKRFRNRLRDTLLKTKKDAKSALVLAKAETKRHAPELQSPDRSVIFSLKTASASTIRPISKVDSAIPLTQDLSCNENEKESSSKSISTVSTATLRELSGSNPSLCPVSAPSREHCKTSGLKSTLSTIVEIDWLTLFLPYDPHVDTRYTTAVNFSGLSDVSLGAVCSASQILNPSACASAQVIRIADLDMGKTIRLNGAFTNKVDVIFAHERRQDIGVHLTRLQT